MVKQILTASNARDLEKQELPEYMLQLPDSGRRGGGMTQNATRVSARFRRVLPIAAGAQLCGFASCFTTTTWPLDYHQDVRGYARHRL